MNNATKILAAAALTLAAMGAAQAETYEGVLTVNSTASRAAIQATGVNASHSDNIAATAFGQGVTMVAASTDRSAVRAEGYAAARSANIAATAYGQGVTQLRDGSVQREAVRVEARAAARNPVL